RERRAHDPDVLECSARIVLHLRQDSPELDGESRLAALGRGGDLADRAASDLAAQAVAERAQGKAPFAQAGELEATLVVREAAGVREAGARPRRGFAALLPADEHRSDPEVMGGGSVRIARLAAQHRQLLEHDV